MAKRSATRKFFIFGPNRLGGGPGHGLVFENKDRLRRLPRLIVRPAEGGFPTFPEAPRIVYVKKKGRPPRDLEAYLSGYWFVSERLKEIFETVDRDAFAFVECEYVLPDGTLGPRHYLCDVVRTIDAIDLSTSKVSIIKEQDDVAQQQREFYSAYSGAELRFRDDVVGDAHVFFQSRLAGGPICDEILWSACRAVPDLKGVLFRDALKL
ncbi:DUF1629 domain-containing protein [Neorhizobium sp. NCHU2750]|uniref:imm11 family protein n=1 Tax=Neorhizobium sp. NCHU2750 TaxID=1825976 RepID=UPI000EB66195|nr:hypothetical protein NCHU2750_14310 [Neorhizobium sp. NCHU2750]